MTGEEIGVVPKGAPWRCRLLNRHLPAPGGGLATYTCTRCGGMYWQEGAVRDQIKYAEAAIARNDFDEADRIRRDTLLGVGQDPDPPKED